MILITLKGISLHVIQLKHLSRTRRLFCRSSGSMKVFTQKRNPLTGTYEWDTQHDDYDYQQEIARSAFADMLHDVERNQKYNKALQLAIDKLHKQGKEAHVLDIGTGTGLLSIMAVRAGADTVTACEAFKPMAECAKNIIELNGVADKIKLIHKRSTELVVGENGDMERRANILVTEVFDTELIGEGALPTFRHAHKYLLEEGSIVVPDSAVVYVQVVECPTLQKWNKLNDLADDEMQVILQTPLKMRECAGSAAVHDIQLSQLPRQYFRELSEQIPVFNFDWSGRSPLNNKSALKQKFVATETGTAQMLFMWWELIMNPEGNIFLSCAPWWAHSDANICSTHPEDTIPWRDHWMQAVYYFPKELTLTKGNEATLVLCHDEYSLWFYIENDDGSNKKYTRPICECGVHMAYSRTHVSYINDGRRSKIFLAQLHETLHKNAVVLDLNGTTIQALAAAKIAAKKVYIMKNTNLDLGILTDYAKENSIDNVEFISDASEDILKEVTHVVCDPNFSGAILPWDNLKMAYLLRKYKELLNDAVKVIPERCEIHAMPVEFMHLHKIRMPIEVCEGIRMTAFDYLIEEARRITDEELEAQPLWEYPCLCRGVPKQILAIDLHNLKPTYAADAIHHILTPDGDNCVIVNGFAVWCVWYIGGKAVSAGPLETPVVGQRVNWDPHTRQAVKLLKYPMKVTNDDAWTYQVVCDLEKGDFQLKIDLHPKSEDND